jgi:hypothetical protein
VKFPHFKAPGAEPGRLFDRFIDLPGGTRFEYSHKYKKLYQEIAASGHLFIAV